MHYYVEQWKPRPEWLALTPEDRGKVLFDLSPAIQGLVDAGIELVGYFVNHTNGGSAKDFSFLRVWKMPEKEWVQRIADTLEKTGWHEFFEPVNSQGEILTPQVAIPYLIGL